MSETISQVLTPQEERLILCAARGEWWEPYPGAWDEDNIDPATAASWDSARDIRAELIRTLITGDTWPGQERPWPVSTKGLMVLGARIAGPIDLEGASFHETLWLHRCAIPETVSLTDAECRTVSFRFSHLAKGIDAHRARIDGSLSLKYATVHGTLDVRGAYIGGQFSLTGGRFLNLGGVAIAGDGMNIDADILLNDGCEVEGQVSLNGVKVGNQIACHGSSFTSHDLPAISLTSATVGSGVFLRDGFVARGEVRLRATHIGGRLACYAARFENPGGVALDLNGAVIAADLLFRDGFRAIGEVTLRGARIGGRLSCRAAHFENSGAPALSAVGTTVATDATIDAGTVALGEVRFARAEIHGNLRIEDSTFSNPHGNALDLTLADIGAGLFLNRLRPLPGQRHGLDGKLLLAQAKCRAYCDDTQSWPAPHHLELDGFTYDRFHDSETSWKVRQKWLLRQDPRHLHKSFRPQPWTQAINVLRAMGHEEDARDLAVARENARLRSHKTAFFQKFWMLVLWAAVAYGYKPWRAFAWSVAFVFAGWLVFSTAGHDGFMAPSDGNVRVSSKWDEHFQLPKTYPPFNSAVYAIDIFVPVITLGEKEAWEPALEQTIPDGEGLMCENPKATLAGSRMDRMCTDMRSHFAPQIRAAFFKAGGHRVVYWIETVAGWILVSLFIAGMSGIMKKE